MALSFFGHLSIMSSTERFLRLSDELEKAINGNHWELAEDLFAERGRLLESGDIKALTPVEREDIRQRDARCEALIRQKQKKLMGEAQRIHDIEKYSRQDS